MEKCFEKEKCYFINHSKVLYEILPKCRFEAMQHLNISNSAPVLQLPLTDLQQYDQISSQKIGSIVHLNYSKISQEAIDIFQNLTYDYLEAIKYIIFTSEDLKQNVCGSNLSPVKYSYDRFKNVPAFSTREYLNFPAKIQKILKSMNYAEFLAIQEITKFNSHFKWILCIPVIKIIDPEHDESYKTAKIKPILEIGNCNKWAHTNDFWWNAICKIKV